MNRGLGSAVCPCAPAVLHWTLYEPASRSLSKQSGLCSLTHGTQVAAAGYPATAAPASGIVYFEMDALSRVHERTCLSVTPIPRGLSQNEFNQATLTDLYGKTMEVASL